jgi:hypothetical protein
VFYALYTVILRVKIKDDSVRLFCLNDVTAELILNLRCSKWRCSAFSVGPALFVFLARSWHALVPTTARRRLPWAVQFSGALAGLSDSAGDLSSSPD